MQLPHTKRAASEARTRDPQLGKLFFTASIILYIKYLFYIQKQFAYNLHNKITACHITNLCSRSNLMQKLRS